MPNSGAQEACGAPAAHVAVSVVFLLDLLCVCVWVQPFLAGVGCYAACRYGFIRTVTVSSNTALSPAPKLAQIEAVTIDNFFGRKSEMLRI